MVKRNKFKKIQLSSKSAIKFALYAIGSFLIVQGALALFPKITGTTSIIIGFLIITFLGILELTKRI